MYVIWSNIWKKNIFQTNNIVYHIPIVTGKNNCRGKKIIQKSGDGKDQNNPKPKSQWKEDCWQKFWGQTVVIGNLTLNRQEGWSIILQMQKWKVEKLSYPGQHQQMNTDLPSLSLVLRKQDRSPWFKWPCYESGMILFAHVEYSGIKTLPSREVTGIKLTAAFSLPGEMIFKFWMQCSSEK